MPAAVVMTSKSIRNCRFQVAKPIGWDGKSLQDMLAEQDRLFAETGHYWGLEALELIDCERLGAPSLMPGWWTCTVPGNLALIHETLVASEAFDQVRLLPDFDPDV